MCVCALCARVLQLFDALGNVARLRARRDSLTLATKRATTALKNAKARHGRAVARALRGAV